MTLKLNGTNSEAAPAYAGDDADTGLQCGTNELKLVTGGTARATVDSSGRLLVGTSSSSSQAKLLTQGQVSNSSAGGILSIQRGEAATSISSGEGIGNIHFTDNASNKFASIFVQADAAAGASDFPGRLVFCTTADGASNTTERLRITSDGTLKLSNSPGIDFSQIQTNASGMSSETLDSYEEGTWTPTCESNGNIGTSQYTNTYTKIGRLVTVNCDIHALDNITSTNPIKIGGLPFAPSVTSGEYGAAACHGERYGHITIVAFIQYLSNAWVIRFRKGVGNNNYNDLRHEDINDASDNNLRFTLTYEVP